MKIQDILNKHFKDLLTEDVNNEIQTMFETLVESKVEEKLEEEIAKKELMLEESNRAEMVSFKNMLIEKMNEYINMAVNDFLIENEAVITENFKVHTAENLMEGISSLLKECHMNVPSSKSQIMKSLHIENSAMKDELNDALNSSINRKRQLIEYKKALVFQRLTEDLIDTDKEKIMKLIKGTTTNDISAFKKKVKMLIENLNISSDYEPEYLRENTDMRFEHENTRSGIDKYLPNF